MKKYTLLIWLFLVNLITVFAQDTTNSVKEAEQKIINLALEDAVNYAIQNNVLVKRQDLSLQNLKKRAIYSWNNVSPSVSASASYQTNFIEPTSSSWSLSSSVSLRLNPSVYTTIKGANLNYEKGITDYETTKKTIELNVRKTYLNLLYLKENLNLQKRNLETARQRANSSNEKYKKGQLSQLDLLTSQYNYESLKPSIESLEINLENAIQTFKQTIGVPQDLQIELVGSLEDYYSSYNLDFEYNVENLPAIKNLESQISSSKNSLLATRFSAWGPSVSASYSYSVSGNSSVDKTSKRDSVSLGVSLPIDGFLPWSSGALSIDNQKTALNDLLLQKENQIALSKLEVENLKKQINQAQSQLKNLRSNVTLAQKAYDMTLQAYNHGAKDILTLQNASDSVLKSKIAVQSQMYTIISLVLDLENIVGLPFETLTIKEQEK